MALKYVSFEVVAEMMHFFYNRWMIDIENNIVSDLSVAGRYLQVNELITNCS